MPKEDRLGGRCSQADMGVCAGGCPIPTFTNSGFNITFGSETFKSFNSCEDDLNIVWVASFIITKIMAKF